jgi:hypothetical protein
MSTIRTLCPRCMSTVDLDPPEILLIAVPSAAATGSYAYHCGACQHVTAAPVSHAAFVVLLTAGVQVQSADSTPPPEQAPLCMDDLIEFHRLLTTADWFTQLVGPNRPPSLAHPAMPQLAPSTACGMRRAIQW